MQAKTFTESARRAQIVAAAIETIAEEGYAKASFTKIAARAGLSSTGLISYHFANKRELVEQVVTAVYSELGRALTERVDAQSSASAALRAYIESNVEFASAHALQMRALLNIFISGDLDYDEDSERDVVSPVERILRWGQDTGEFRDFNVRVMATTIQRSVEGPTFLLARDPDLDTTEYAAELVRLFELATGSTS
ncbi:TetR/AcrR family transcriptional regulator [Prauserella cavernicola]|uniref:TetR family transcriptional regulator n=1 Tax=Prauserella cavernicola TaxID=2800127 RepID=A0A934V8D8_9PSEU|nr:TetR/AcrR family transcriptional regulator [Prauserella cavernicola]MBK1787648.1 TetR family transcriptional regulator [Prauserella cavernicola]